MSEATIPLQFKPVDDKTADAVRAFMRDHHAAAPEAAAAAPQPAAPGAAATQVTEHALPSNSEFDQPNQAAQMSSGYVDTRLMTVTDAEKRIYVKCLVNDAPFTLELELFGGALKVEMRTRTLEQQQRINDLLSMEFSQKKEINADDIAMAAKRTEHYLLAVMVQRLNGVSFAAPDILNGTLDTVQVAMRNFFKTKLETMHVPKMTALVNAIRIFESKSARLASEAKNESFWQPLS